MNSGKPDYLMYSVRLYFIGIDRIGLVGWPVFEWMWVFY